jgi:excinuclease ABC subunit C
MKLRKTLASIPKKPGVYLFKDRSSRPLYVGKSINLKNRLLSYFGHRSHLGEKTSLLLGKTTKIDFILVESEIEALLLEASLIKKYLPPFNARSKDDKSPLYIKISTEEFPKVLVVRKTEIKKDDLSFGPFPSSKSVRSVLRFLRKIFPFCSCKKETGKPCLYTHLNLCQPSPRAILKLPPEEKKKQKRLYRKNIRDLVKFLKGESKQLIESKKRQMERKSRQRFFEEAAKLRDQIGLLAYITQSFRPPTSYLKNPTLLADQRKAELTSLFEALKKSGLLLKKQPQRIEAFDISNISGQKATGSMVVFMLGEPEKSSYRRFRLRRKRGGDPAMMAEVLARRLNHPEWPQADLILLDGGKPQVSAIQELFASQNIKTPFIGLAKRKEEIIFLTQKKRFSNLRLDQDLPAIHLLQRIRDEAHRFALSYHRHLRRKID